MLSVISLVFSKDPSFIYSMISFNMAEDIFFWIFLCAEYKSTKFYVTTTLESVYLIQLISVVLSIYQN